MHDEHPAIQYTTKGHDNRADAFLRYVDGLLSGKIRHLQKMEPQRDSLETQARRKAALQSTFWGIL